MKKWFDALFVKSEANFVEPFQPDTAYYVICELIEKRTPITIKFDQDPKSYISMFLEVNVIKQCIIIDEIMPKNGHLLASQNTPFTLTASHEGITFKFKTKIISYGQKQGIHFYRLPFPERYQYLQKREVFRAPITHATPCTVSFIIPGHPHFRGYLADISPSGFQLHIPHNASKILSPSLLVPKCHLNTWTQERMEFDIKICHAHYERGKQITQVGCQIIHYDPIHLQSLSKLVSQVRHSNQAQSKPRFT